MKIIIAADTYYPNIDGSSYFSQRLSRKLVERGHDVLVIAPSTSRRDGYSYHQEVKILSVASIPTFFHHDYRFVAPLFLKHKVEKVMKEFEPDLIHIQGHFFLEEAAMKAGKEFGIPVLGTNHFMPENLLHYAHLGNYSERILKKIMWKHFLHVFHQLPIVTTPTRTARTVLRQVGFENDVEVVSCGVDLGRFNPKNNGQYLKKIFHLPDKPILLSVGRLAPEKNIDVVLKAVALALKKQDFQTVIGGDGMEMAELKELTKRLGIEDCVSFLGYVEDRDLPNLYAIATAFVMAGTFELQSIATMEAMASGLPIIAANSLALPELVAHGKNGYLFEPNDHVELGGWVSRMLRHDSRRLLMAANSLKIIKDHDINKVVDHYLSLYESFSKKRSAEYLYR